MIHTELRTGVPYIDERMTDISRIISHITSKYTDQTHVFLHQEELVAECHKKIAEIISANKWQQFVDKPRGEFFAFVKTAFNNHVKSIMVRNRMTAKRGYDPYAKKKNVDLSLDDPESGIQVSNRNTDGSEVPDELRDYDTLVQGHEVENWLQDIEPLLTPLEFLVLRQMSCPNQLAYLYEHITPSSSNRRSIRISKENLAAGLGMSFEYYSEIEESVKNKVEQYRMDPQEEDILFNSSVRALEKVFDLQIPPNLERIVIQRLVTLAARDQYEKLDETVKIHMRNIGARVPEVQGTTTMLKCRGVLFREDHRVCQSCNLHEQCKIEAANIGLGNMTISPKLLGARSQRISTICVNTSAEAHPVESAAEVDVIEDEPSQDEVQTATVVETVNETGPRDEEIMAYLGSKLKKVMNKGEILFKFNDKLSHGKVRYIFIIKDRSQSPAFLLRFCKPTDSVKNQLEKHRTGYYLSSSMSADEACRLIDQHINDSFN